MKITLCFLCCHDAPAYAADGLYSDSVYSDRIKTVLLHKEGNAFSFPLIQLGSEEKLQLEFDDLDADVKDYYYTVIHCNADWTGSALQTNQYIGGYADDKITEYRYSFNTIQKYTHYTLLFPNQQMQPLVAGNYILKVYADYDPNKIVLIRRFMVFSPKISTDASVQRATIIADRNSRQEVNFTLHCGSVQVNNPYGDIRVVLMQNGRWDNAISNLKPLFIKDNDLIYQYEEGNTFPGGSEFRVFDTRSLRYHSERIAAITYDSSYNHVFLTDDQRRSSIRYTATPDFNGKYYVKIQEGNNSAIEADYTYVHFRLSCAPSFPDGNVYVFGALTDWKLSEETRMKYNEDASVYETTLYLKQGFYNYDYVFVKNNTTLADDTAIEGSHYETENEYFILVYHRGIGMRYDELIGFKSLNSIRMY